MIYRINEQEKTQIFIKQQWWVRVLFYFISIQKIQDKVDSAYRYIKRWEWQTFFIVQRISIFKEKCRFSLKWFNNCKTESQRIYKRSKSNRECYW